MTNNKPLFNTEEPLIQKHLTKITTHQYQIISHLARQLLIIELSLSAFYAIILTLLARNNLLIDSSTIVLTFSCWIIAFIGTIVAILPPLYTSQSDKDITDINHFINQALRYKLMLLLPSLALLMIGIIAIVWGLLP